MSSFYKEKYLSSYLYRYQSLLTEKSNLKYLSAFFTIFTKVILSHSKNQKKKHTSFYKQHFYKQHHAEIGKKIKQMISNTLRLNLSHLKIIHILHPCYQPQIIGHTLKNKHQNKCACNHEIIRLIIMKMKMKKKKRLHRYDINRRRSRHGHKYNKYKICLTMIMFICIKQQLSNIWSSVHEKVKEHWHWVKKKRCL